MYSYQSLGSGSPLHVKERSVNICGVFDNFNDKIYEFNIPTFTHTDASISFKIHYKLNSDMWNEYVYYLNKIN